MVMHKCCKALFAIVIVPLLMLLAGCHSGDGSSESAVKPESKSTAKLERIVVVASPVTTQGVSELTLAVGNKQPLEAIGYYSDGSSRALTDLGVSDWHTSNQDVGRFDELGVFTGADVGSTTLTVTKDGITSNAVTVTVSPAVVTALQVTPSPVNVAKGQTQQLVATATYSDGSSADVSSAVTWAVGDTNLATVTPAGLLSGADVGNTTVTATKDGVTAIP